MFTGIVEEVGEIQGILSKAGTFELAISGKIIFDDLKIGDSVSVNGVCLTVTKFTSSIFYADIMKETRNRSSLGKATKNTKVNLERALGANGRFGGHIVSGHIDGTGIISNIQKSENAILYTIQAESKITDQIVEKGSIAIDGISLTVIAVADGYFKVSVIPHTAKERVLSLREVGSLVNLETDVLAKYIQKNEENSEKKGTKIESKITMEFLRNAGF